MVGTKQRFDKAVANLSDVIGLKAKGIRYVTRAVSTNNYQEFMKQGVPYVISREGLADAVYTEPNTNIFLRVWHDDIHYKRELTFSLEDELTVLMHMENQALPILRAMGITELEIADALLVLKIDIGDQSKYWEEHKAFVENQAEFVWVHFQEQCLPYTDKFHPRSQRMTKKVMGDKFHDFRARFRDTATQDGA